MNNDYNNQQPQQPYQQPYQPPMKQPGDSQATGALVCGIISLVFAWFGYSSLIALAAGIVGIIAMGQGKNVIKYRLHCLRCMRSDSRSFRRYVIITG